jgi:hypothetical protein
MAKRLCPSLRVWRHRSQLSYDQKTFDYSNRMGDSLASAMIHKPATPVHISSEALDWALLHIRRFGDTIFLPRAFEYEAIQHDWIRVRAWLEERDMREWAPRPYRRFLAAKTPGSFRYITQLDPIEHLAFAGLMYDVGRELESFRATTTQRLVFSWRFSPQPDGTMYDPATGWVDFNERCLELAELDDVSHVVVADIADFFPHLYLHPLERTLSRCVSTQQEAYCILRILKGWNALVSYGVPIGPPSGRILADATLSDLDEALVGNGARYCRYSDDCRIFCSSEAEARQRLEFLARHLFELYGLTLQSTKTSILPAIDYVMRFSLSPERLAAESLEGKFEELLEKAGVEIEYGESIDYDDLPTEIQEEIDSLNLAEVVREQISRDKCDPILISLLLQRLGQLDQDEVVEDLLEYLRHLEPVIDSIVRYLSALHIVSEERRQGIGKRILDAVRSEGTSAYQAVCLLSVFAGGTEFNSADEFERLYDAVEDDAKRELMLALGRTGKARWFFARRRDCSALGPWLRRAFLAGASCMKEDARVAFFKTEERSDDILERAVLAWVKVHPFA